MRYKPLPDIHCMNCFKLIVDSVKKGYLKYFCDTCLQIDTKEEEHEQQQQTMVGRLL